MKITDKVREFLDEKAKKLATQFYSYVISEFDENPERIIESPIEQLFYIEWRFRQFEDPEFRWDLLPQTQCKETGQYRIDFTISFSDEDIHKFGTERYYEITAGIDIPLIGIEIDSHIWHEKTKEQVQYHKKRERFLISNEWKLIRFTGAEIFKNPPKCVDEAIEIIMPLRQKYLKELLKKLKGRK